MTALQLRDYQAFRFANAGSGDIYYRWLHAAFIRDCVCDVSAHAIAPLDENFRRHAESMRRDD